MGVLSALTLVYRETWRAIEESQQEVISESEISFSKWSGRLGRGRGAGDGKMAPAGSAARFEWIRSPAIYSDALVFEHRFYLAGPSGVSVYGGRGGLVSRYRPGQELPAAAVVQLATGLLGDGAGRSSMPRREERVCWFWTGCGSRAGSCRYGPTRRRIAI